MSMSPRKSSDPGFIITFLLSLALIGISLLLVANRQYIIDQITVWEYQPTSEIANLAERAGLNDHGKFLFYASQPKLDGTQDLNTECERTETVTSILGCYNDNRIYIYDVTDTRLDGIREVTAAHETMHAVYYRLSDDEKDKINQLIEAEYSQLKADKDFAELMAFYDRTEPGQRDNELFSIIATQVAEIDAQLESYYSRFFYNRQAVVALYDKYSSVFNELEDKADALATQINALASSISERSAQYNADVSELNSDISLFDARAASGDFASQAQFYAERAVLVSRVSELNALRESVSDDIAKYYSLLAEYNSIASESIKLNNSIDSTLAPAPSV